MYTDSILYVFLDDDIQLHGLKLELDLYKFRSMTWLFQKQKWCSDAIIDFLSNLNVFLYIKFSAGRDFYDMKLRYTYLW